MHAANGSSSSKSRLRDAQREGGGEREAEQTKCE